MLWLRQSALGLGVSRARAQCFFDARDPALVDHQRPELLAQRLPGLALGYEELNDHASLRLDPLLAVAAGQRDPRGLDRWQDQGPALASPSTLHRLERRNNKASR